MSADRGEHWGWGAHRSILEVVCCHGWGNWGQTLHHSTCPYCLISPCCCGLLIFSEPRARKKRKHLEDLIQEREAAREREASEREERRWRRRRNKEKEKDKSERIDGYEKPKTEERRHREAVEREERRERETRERDEPYLALLELIAKK